MSEQESERESEYLSESEGRFSDDGSAAFSNDVKSEPRRNQMSAQRAPSLTDNGEYTPSGSFPLGQSRDPRHGGTESGQSYVDDADNRDSGTSFSAEGYITVNQVRLACACSLNIPHACIRFDCT